MNKSLKKAVVDLVFCALCTIAIFVNFTRGNYGDACFLAFLDGVVLTLAYLRFLEYVLQPNETLTITVTLGDREDDEPEGGQ